MNPADYPLAVTLTRYYPRTTYATPEEERMEGGLNDRLGRRNHTLEEHQADPAAHPYVSLAGDDAIFAYGERVIIPALGVPSAAWRAKARAAGLSEPLDYYVARVVDTGGHFRGEGKVIRIPGREPLDVAMSAHDPNTPGILAAIARRLPYDTLTRTGAKKTAGTGAIAAVVALLGFKLARWWGGR